MYEFMDDIGFSICALALGWLILRVLRIERAIRSMAGGKWASLLGRHRHGD